MPAKVARVNMDGSNPMVLVNDVDRPQAISIDLDKKLIYFSTEYPAQVRIFTFYLVMVIIYKLLKRIKNPKFKRGLIRTMSKFK